MATLKNLRAEIEAGKIIERCQDPNDVGPYEAIEKIGDKYTYTNDLELERFDTFKELYECAESYFYTDEADPEEDLDILDTWEVSTGPSEEAQRVLGALIVGDNKELKRTIGAHGLSRWYERALARECGVHELLQGCEEIKTLFDLSV